MKDDSFFVGTARCKKEHEKDGKISLLVEIDDPDDEMREHLESGDEIWLPSSQIHDDSEVYSEGHYGKLVITKWLARQREWIE